MEVYDIECTSSTFIELINMKIKYSPRLKLFKLKLNRCVEEILIFAKIISSSSDIEILQLRTMEGNPTKKLLRNLKNSSISFLSLVSDFNNY